MSARHVTSAVARMITTQRKTDDPAAGLKLLRAFKRTAPALNLRNDVIEGFSRFAMQRHIGPRRREKCQKPERAFKPAGCITRDGDEQDKARQPNDKPGADLPEKSKDLHGKAPFG